MFVAVFGGAAYWNPAHPTSDHIIPGRLFYLLLAEARRVGVWKYRLDRSEFPEDG